jgi:hypothetical protein
MGPMKEVLRMKADQERGNRRPVVTMEGKINERLNTTLEGNSDGLDKMEVKDVEAKKGKNDVEKLFNRTTKREAQQQETTQPQEHTCEQLLRHPVDGAHVQYTHTDHNNRKQHHHSNHYIYHHNTSTQQHRIKTEKLRQQELEPHRPVPMSSSCVTPSMALMSSFEEAVQWFQVRNSTNSL